MKFPCIGFIVLIFVNTIYCDPIKYKTNHMLYKRYTGLEARGPSNVEYKVNILTKLESDYEFPLVIGQDEKVGLWLLTRETPGSFKSNTTEAKTVALYDPRSLPREVALAENYSCLPTEQSCNQLRIPNFEPNDIGVYTFRFDSSNYLTMKTFTFNVTAYMDSINILCSKKSNDSVCVYNADTQTLSVIADEPVDISCDVKLIQNDDYPVSAQFNFISELYGEECMGNSELNTLPDQSGINTQSFNLIKKELRKNCTRTFTKQDMSKSYSCQLNPIVSKSDPISYQQTKTYESLDIKLDVQYGPDQTLPLDPIPVASSGLFNKTQMVGDENVNQKYICPFIGNPKPLYYWRIVSVNTNSSKLNNKLRTLTPSEEFSLSDSAEFPIPSDLQVGQYSFECKAKVQGMVNKFSPVVKFNLEMIPQPPAPVRKSQTNPDSLYMQNGNNSVNVGGIVGGIIGGLAVLALVVIVVVAVIRIRKNNNSKNEIEKAKELDIDINDHHQDLNNRKANMVQQQQQQQVKQQLGNKVIAGLMPNPTAQAYASIAHAAAAAAQSNQQRNNGFSNQNQQDGMNFNSTTTTSMGSHNNLLNQNLNGNLLTHNNQKSQSYNNPGFFESASYTTQNPLESPPPYDAALHQPIKKDSPTQQQRLNQQQLINQQQKDYMGSSTRLISGSNTPIQQQRQNTSQSYTVNTPQGFSLMNSTPSQVSSSMQQLQYNTQQNQSQASLQYTSVHNMENRARSRNPLNGPADMENQQQAQYTTMAAQLSSNPIDV